MLEHKDSGQHESLEQEAQLRFVVSNTHMLEAGLSATYTFGRDGGSIGASPADSWHLRDKQGNVRLNHARISTIDGQFCLTDSSGACYLNGATIPVGWGKSARLNNNDVVLIGSYQLRAQHTQTGDALPANQNNLEQVFDSELSAFDIGSEGYESHSQPRNDDSIDDPLVALSALNSSIETLLPFNTDEAEKKQDTDFLLARDQQWRASDRIVPADSERAMGSAMVLNKPLIGEENPMDDKTLERLEEEVGRNYSAQAGAGLADTSYQQTDYESFEGGSTLDESNHLVTGPLLRGLGAPVGDVNNMAAMQAMSEEMGASLQAAIKGLLELHQQVAESRYGVMNKNLQPIEDNPLRLGQNYQDTVQTMFDGQRSAVHLSAPAAIGESLNNIKHHNEVVQAATADALIQILRAFSPQVLLRRFQAYRRPGQAAPESEQAWAWEMYQSYYSELTSGRQQGFEKLFWEIFDQSYDKTLREKQREA